LLDLAGEFDDFRANKAACHLGNAHHRYQFAVQKYGFFEAKVVKSVPV
jgi:hypothetical protein